MRHLWRCAQAAAFALLLAPLAAAETPAECAGRAAAIVSLSAWAVESASAPVLLDLADLLRARGSPGDEDRARELYARAAGLQPESAPAHYWLGSLTLARGDAELGMALRALEVASRLVPGDFYYRAALAEARARSEARSPSASEGTRVAVAACRLDQGAIAEVKSLADSRVTTTVMSDRLLWLRLKMRADPAAAAEADWNRSSQLFDAQNFAVAMDAADMAQQKFERARVMPRVKDCVMRRAYCLELLGASRRREAFAAYDQALELTRKHGFRESEGYIRCRRGILLAQEGRHAEARAELEAALALALETRSGEEATARTWLAVLDCESGDPARAELAFSQALAAAGSSCRPDEVAAALHARAECRRGCGRLLDAVADLRAACELDRGRGALHRSAFDSRLQLAELLLRVGDTAEAGRLLESVAREAAGADVTRRARALLLEGWRSWLSAHDLRGFEARVDEAAGLAGGPDVALPKLLHRARFQLGLAYLLKGDSERGARQFERIGEAPAPEVDRRERVMARLQQLRCLLQRSAPGDLEHAERVLCEALRALENAADCGFGDGDDLGPLLSRRDGLEAVRLSFAEARSELAYAQGRIGAAIHLTATTTRALSTMTAQVRRAPVLGKLALYLLDGGRSAEAEQVAGAALEQAGREGTTDTFGYLAARGYARARSGKTTEALQDLDEAAFQLRQYLVAVAPPGASGLEGRSSFQELYDTLVSMLLAAKDARRAWELVQERSFQLLRQGELYRPPETGDADADRWAAEYRKLRERWESLESAVAALQSTDAARPERLQELVLAREKAFQHLTSASGQESLRSAVVTPDTLDHLQSQLPPDSGPCPTRVVQYAFLSRAPQPALVAFLIGPGPDDFESVTLTLPVSAAGQSPERLVGALSSELAARFGAPVGGQRWTDAASSLGRLVVAPILARLAGRGIRRLIIAPDGPLSSVPFEALSTGAGPPLLESMEVSYLNPAVAVRLDVRPVNVGSARLVAAGNADGTVAQAEAEVQSVGALFPQDRRDVRVRSEASLKWLTGALEACGGQPAVLHLATHGLLSDDPWESNLVFADGPLTLRDVSTRLRGALRSWLVVLSACESGRGRATGGPSGGQMLSLARAFAQAGAGTLVASLWKVDDRSTAELMTAFYRELAKGSPPGAALRAAKLAVKRTFPDPHHWAPFVLLGRGW